MEDLGERRYGRVEEARQEWCRELVELLASGSDRRDEPDVHLYLVAGLRPLVGVIPKYRQVARRPLSGEAVHGRHRLRPSREADVGR